MHRGMIVILYLMKMTTIQHYFQWYRLRLQIFLKKVTLSFNYRRHSRKIHFSRSPWNPNWRKNEVRFYYDDNDESVSIEYRSKEAGGFSREYGNSLPQYHIKQDKGDAFVLKSNMFFDGNLIISVNGIRQELIDGATSAFNIRLWRYNSTRK